MKIKIELEINLGDDVINPNDKEERDWLFNHILTKSNLSLHDKEIGDTIGELTKIVKCEEINQFLYNYQKQFKIYKNGLPRTIRRMV